MAFPVPSPGRRSQVEPPVTRWSEHNADRQDRIMRAAVDCVESGDPDFPLQAVAAAAGVSKSVVYRQFDNREGLERRVRTHIAAEVIDAIESGLDMSQGSIREVLSRTIRLLVDWASAHPRLMDFMRTGPSAEGPDTIDALTWYRSAFAAKANDILEGLATLVGLADRDFRSVAFAISVMVEGSIAEQSRHALDGGERERQIETLTNYAWYVLDGDLQRRGLRIDPSWSVLAVVNFMATRTARNTGE